MRAFPPSRSQRGAGNIKFFIVLVILGAVIFLCVKLVPPYVNNYQLQDTLQTESRFFAAHTKNEDKVREVVWAQVQNLGIPVERDQIKVEMFGHSARVTVDYSVVVDFPGYTWKHDFHTTGESPAF
jgi:hypothetical protein